MNTPRDPGLFLASFMGISLSVIVTAWILLPVQRHHGEDEEPAAHKSRKAARPEEVIGKADAVLTKVEELLQQLENDKGVKAKIQAAPKGDKNNSEAAPPKTPAPAPERVPGKTTASTH